MFTYLAVVVVLVCVLCVLNDEKNETRLSVI
jgi:hypothetical protein